MLVSLSLGPAAVSTFVGIEVRLSLLYWILEVTGLVIVAWCGAGMLLCTETLCGDQLCAASVVAMICPNQE